MISKFVLTLLENKVCPSIMLLATDCETSKCTYSRIRSCALHYYPHVYGEGSSRATLPC
jgi:hypothetical protein